MPSENTQFKPGNQLWKTRSSHGRKPIFQTPEQLWEACCEYFQWVEDNPLWEDKIVSYQGVTTHEPVCKMRAMTIGGLCVFLDMDRRTWLLYAERPDFVPITTRVDEVIREQKFSGAAADLLNANIIARDLGLADKSEMTGKDGGPIETVDATPLELARRLAFALRLGAQSKAE